MNICVISDTHIRPGRALPPEILSLAIESDHLIHAGDICSIDVLYELRAIRQTSAVYGNCDPWEVRHALKSAITVTLGGVKIGVTHGDGSKGTTLERALEVFSGDVVDVVVFGHSHIPIIEQRGNTLLVNPGSATQPRTQPRRSYAMLNVAEGKVHAKLCYL